MKKVSEDSSKWKKNKTYKRASFCLAVLCLVALCTTAGWADDAQKKPSGQNLKILHMMSYHSGWEDWTIKQLKGFQSKMVGMNVEYRIFEMDAKRKNTPESLQQAAAEGKLLIDTWHPDLVYTTDDAVQGSIVQDYINSSIPFIFSGVNNEPEAYGFDKSTNVRGVLEREHSIEAIRLLSEILPNLKKIAIITDAGSTWPAMIKRIKGRVAAELDGIAIARVDVVDTYADYKRRIAEYQGTVDVIMHLGVHSFKDDAEVNVPFETVMQWTIENSTVPEVSFWADRVAYGSFMAVTVDGYEQGKAAGEMARGILLGEKKVADYAFVPTKKGKVMINLARANMLQIKLKSSILLAAEITDSFGWKINEN